MYKSHRDWDSNYLFYGSCSKDSFLLNCIKILKILQDLSRERQKLVIVVTHNAAFKDMAEKVIRIKSGRIESIETNDNPKAIEEIEW